MADTTEVGAVREICRAQNQDRTRLLDIVLAVHEKFGFVSPTAMDMIAEELSTHRVEAPP